MSESTKGYELEIRAHRLAWYMGYFARRRIMLFSDEGNPITDIDVIGMKFDITLNPDIILIETKSEKGFASILKVRGLFEYFASKSAYIIRPNITPDIIRFAENLQINAMHTSRLDEIEKTLGIDVNDWSFTYSKEYDYKVDQKIRLLLDKKYNNEVNILNDFWVQQNPFYSIKILIDFIRYLENRRIKEEDKFVKNALSFLVTSNLTLFVISSLKSAGVLYKYPTHQRLNVFQEKLISGKLSYGEKEELLDKFFGFLTNYTKNLGRTMKIKRSDLTLLPDYTNELYELLNNLIDKSKYAIILPQLMDIIETYVINENRIKKTLIEKILSLTEDDYKNTVSLIDNFYKFLFKSAPDFLKSIIDNDS